MAVGALAGDVRSVHFLSFPEVNEAYFDVEIERRVKRMQRVIELARNIREKNNRSFKVSSVLSYLHLLSILCRCL
jgi:valyl-tRNA synthetase